MAKKSKTKEVVIRRANITDSGRICNILKKHVIHELPHLPEPDLNHTTLWINETIMSGLVLVADMGGTFIGSIGGRVAFWPWSRNNQYFHGEWYCVMPGYAEARTGLALLQKARKIANLSQMDMVFNLYGTDATNEKERLMHTEGFTDCGGVMMLKAVVESDEKLIVKVKENA